MLKGVAGGQNVRGGNGSRSGSAGEQVVGLLGGSIGRKIMDSGNGGGIVMTFGLWCSGVGSSDSWRGLRAWRVFSLCVVRVSMCRL